MLQTAFDGKVSPDTIEHLQALRKSIAAQHRELHVLMPWVTLAACEDREAAQHLDQIPSLDRLTDHCEGALDKLSHIEGRSDLTAAIEQSRGEAERLRHRLATLGERAKKMALEMEFGFMFDEDRQMLSIGYRCNDGTLDPNFYDLLASEARLASFFAIAKGDVPAKHWFRLGRTLTPIDHSSGLISWSGSMFEYLMPSLVMRAPSGSLLEQTNRLVVRRQEEYGNELGVPWGISESAYNARNIEQTYQYSSFGVPDLGYKRGLNNDTVIAPYATGLATMVDPAAAVRNYDRMRRLGGCGDYGWYEALDYTRSRLPEGVKFAVVRAYMAHHQAMTLVAIGNALHDGAMRARFPRGPHCAGCGTAAAGTHAARYGARATGTGDGRDGFTGHYAGRGNRAAIPFGAFPRTADADSLQRPLLGDGDCVGVGLQPLARYFDHALARGCDLRSMGRVYFPARCAQWRTCGRPDTSRRVSNLTATRSCSVRTARKSRATTVH
ncbi:MAG: glucoamylase family protein [Rhizomicrobium sp.]